MRSIISDYIEKLRDVEQRHSHITSRDRWASLLRNNCHDDPGGDVYEESDDDPHDPHLTFSLDRRPLVARKPKVEK